MDIIIKNVSAKNSHLYDPLKYCITATDKNNLSDQFRGIKITKNKIDTNLYNVFGTDKRRLHRSFIPKSAIPEGFYNITKINKSEIILSKQSGVVYPVIDNILHKQDDAEHIVLFDSLILSYGLTPKNSWTRINALYAVVIRNMKSDLTINFNYFCKACAISGIIKPAIIIVDKMIVLVDYKKYTDNKYIFNYDNVYAVVMALTTKNYEFNNFKLYPKGELLDTQAPKIKQKE